VSEHEGHIELERSVDSIVVGVRHRKNPSEDIDPLMASIKKLGLLQPVTITPDGVLVCGARRLAAVKRLGWRTLKVWVRSGISDELNRLLAQQDENEQRKPLNQLEQAALFRELRKLIHEDAQRRQKATRFGAHSRPQGDDGPGESPGPPPGPLPGPLPGLLPGLLPGHGDSRHQAAIAVTGKASYHLLEEISAIERIAADRSLPETLRRLADIELEAIQNGGDVHPAYERIRSARALIDADDTPMPTGAVSDEEVENLAIEAMGLLGQSGRRGTKRPRPTTGTSGRSLRAFLLTWADLDGWSRYYNPSEIAAQLKKSDWEMFERVLAETIAFADEVRDLRSASTTASA
jgi:ParB family transcriptional regulator, chromosome partitioning protein